nr:immunoglobulin light chain junction region [Macaca mulatta]MOX51741.1 immunoglobulin light chain junction region [Macaca mulatta]MOX51850.1 immunoglobulin light chain junction region [Macaca mulatta]MOX51977.1 immunoglobulin light chain junction region [Macaca mulatta]MOX51979.1 immunoglobulin light chain junction region [Macaca mulatta]
CQQIYRNPVTF